MKAYFQRIPEIKSHLILTFFLFIILFTFLNECSTVNSYQGCSFGLLVTIILWLIQIFQKKALYSPTKQDFLQTLISVWPNVVLMLISPTAGVIFISIFSLLTLEIIRKENNFHDKTSKTELFAILSILSPIRNTKGAFFHSFLILIPTWLLLIGKKFDILKVENTSLPFILFVFCYRKQLISLLEEKKTIQR